MPGRTSWSDCLGFSSAEYDLRRESRAKLNDIDALYRQYSSDVYRFALYLSGNYAEAEDITSETFVRAWTTTTTIEMATVKGYLFTIARNLFLRGTRKGARHVPLDDELEEGIPAPEADLQRQTEGRQALDRVIGRLQVLPESDRAALLMRAFDELPYEEIARALGLSTSATKVKVHRARLALAKVR
jgi:RNA polymerase sigma-70 factor (ECF subfamily)